MSRQPSDHDERPRLDAAALPDEVQRLWETMLRLDPKWDIHSWLSERADEEMQLIDANLVREKMRLEQRISRIKALSARIRKENDVARKDPHQFNLFDDYSQQNKPIIKEDLLDDERDWEPHPATTHIAYLNDDVGDDPLLAVCAQAILLCIEEISIKTSAPVTLEEIGVTLTPRGVETEELVEALEWLLEHGRIIEVDENEFISAQDS
ncbi:MAG: hypothetical protein QF440_01450 [Candidatus Thalassarchaeaceae archaeon]|nr:hypothetical protein [Candidatus Thalassarchaeaceae archaeon]